jgi:arylsulfatase A-like enzyme
MSDDMGYSDIGCYGGEISTPNLDRLAYHGLRFSQFYNSARCCPTRASLLTGLYPHQTGIGHMTNPSENEKAHDYRLPGYRGFLNENCVTIAEVLKASGYSTLMAGKWHVGKQNRGMWPLQRGFDSYYGILDGATNYFKPSGPRGITLNNDTLSVDDPNYYTTDAFTSHAIQFITQSKTGDKNKPFFLYLAYNAPHWPLQAPKEDIDKYRSRYAKGWEVLRQERFQKMKNMNIIDASLKLARSGMPSWDSLSQEKKNEMAQRRAIYAAQVDRMDQNIGKLLSYLERENLIDNTIILFINDNGACAEGGELGGGRPQDLESRQGYLLSYGEAWANASNTPLRLYKHWTHEGGISSPMIVHWPAGISKKDAGKIIQEYAFLPDIMATCVELAEAKYPKNFNGKVIPSMEGKSLLPLFRGSLDAVHDKPIFWEHEGNKAVRLGKYKLVMQWRNVSENKWELYDIDTDRTETNDLSSALPVKVDEMSRMWQQWASTHNVEPWDNILKITQRP